MWSGEQIYTCRSCLGWYVSRQHTILNMNDMYISVLQTTYHPKHERHVYICSLDHIPSYPWTTCIYLFSRTHTILTMNDMYDGMWSGEQIYTCRSWLGWYVVWRTDIYMSFMLISFSRPHIILNMNDLYISILQTTYHPKHERHVYICSPDHIPS
jgi:hypothetical protein